MQFQPEHKRVRIVDIDGVLVQQINSIDMTLPVVPISNTVEQINEWFSQGDYIVLWSARSREYEDLTRQQVDALQVRYHEIVLGKPLSEEIHIYDDKMIVAHRLVKNEGTWCG